MGSFRQAHGGNHAPCSFRRRGFRGNNRHRGRSGGCAALSPPAASVAGPPAASCVAAAATCVLLRPAGAVLRSMVGWLEVGANCTSPLLILGQMRGPIYTTSRSVRTGGCFFFLKVASVQIFTQEFSRAFRYRALNQIHDKVD